MPRFNVAYRGKWACFSSVVDTFITSFMNKKAYEGWRLKEYGESDYQPAEECNQMTIEEAAYRMCLNHTRSKALTALIETGIGRKAATGLIVKSFKENER